MGIALAQKRAQLITVQNFHKMGHATIELVVYRTFDQRIMHMMIARFDLRYIIIIKPSGLFRPCRVSVICMVLLVTISS